MLFQSDMLTNFGIRRNFSQFRLARTVATIKEYWYALRQEEKVPSAKLLQQVISNSNAFEKIRSPICRLSPCGRSIERCKGFFVQVVL